MITEYRTVRGKYVKRRYRITFDTVRPDGSEQWSADCGCGWWGTFISRRAAELGLRQHRHLDAAAPFDPPEAA